MDIELSEVLALLRCSVCRTVAASGIPARITVAGNEDGSDFNAYITADEKHLPSGWKTAVIQRPFDRYVGATCPQCAGNAALSLAAKGGKDD